MLFGAIRKVFGSDWRRFMVGRPQLRHPQSRDVDRSYPAIWAVKGQVRPDAETINNVPREK